MVYHFIIFGPYREYRFLYHFTIYGPIGVNLFIILAPTLFFVYHLVPLCGRIGVNILTIITTLSSCWIYRFTARLPFSRLPGVQFYHFTALAALTFFTIR